jgi:light-regulated signal transduction histidine kinase (bacteriophytochrome)
LRAIHNYADFLREDLQTTLDGEPKTYLDGIGHAVQEAEELVTDLLELSRIGRRNGPSETVQAGVFLRELLARLDLPQDVEVIMGADWPTIVVNPVLMGQIFQNLVTNASKFNDSTPRQIELDWQPVKKHGREIWGYEFLVRDNCIGIKPHYHEQIFRVFERLHTRQEYDGTGIGLAIVKKAVGTLGGSVRLESQPGEGSTFFVNLPRLTRRNKNE